MANSCFIFPGQGAQKTGMGKSLFEASEEVKSLFQKAEEILGKPLSKICFEGPEEELQKTHNAQVALLVCSIASFMVLKKNIPELTADFFAGLSLGEYSAQIAAGVLPFEEGLRLVEKRALIMQRACEGANGGMASIIGLPLEKVNEICASLPGYMIVANLNCPGQYVISGDKNLLESACAEAKKNGAKLTVILKVSGAFHSRHMENAAKEFKTYLEKVQIDTTKLPQVISNVTGKPYADTDSWATAMSNQIMMPVLWEESMKYAISSGVSKFYELGTGKTLSGMLKRIDKQVNCYNLETFEQLNELK